MTNYNKTQQDQLLIQNMSTGVIITELVSRALIMNRPGTTTEGENLLARLATFCANVNGSMFAPKDPYELEQVLSYAGKLISSQLADKDMLDIINSLMSIMAPGGLKEQLASQTFDQSSFAIRIFGEPYYHAINKFLEFVKLSNIPRVDSYDRFKPVYEKFISLNPDADKIIGEDIMGFFLKCRDCGLR